MSELTQKEWDVVKEAESIIQKEPNREKKLALCEKYIRFHLHLLKSVNSPEEEDKIIFELSAFAVLQDEINEVQD